MSGTPRGRRYLDFFGGILTTSVGHNRPRVVEAVREQVGKLIHSSTLYPNENHVALAEKMAEITPGRLQMSFFTNSGSEANETAIVAAQTYTDNREIVALRHAYSGRTSLTMSVTAHSTWKLGKSFSPDIKHAINPYCYRCPLKAEYPSCGVACAQDIEDVIRTTTSGADRRLHGRADPGRRRLYHPARPNTSDCGGDRPSLRRRLYLRRGADRLWPHGRRTGSAFRTGASSRRL
jgi:4-aminobutyrate aminotransferase-like enzyme